MPKSRVEFWKGKFEKNVARDHKVLGMLEELGWTVQVIWECETQDPVALEHRLRQVLGHSGKAA